MAATAGGTPALPGAIPSALPSLIQSATVNCRFVVMFHHFKPQRSFRQLAAGFLSVRRSARSTWRLISNVEFRVEFFLFAIHELKANSTGGRLPFPKALAEPSVDTVGTGILACPLAEWPTLVALWRGSTG